MQTSSIASVVLLNKQSSECPIHHRYEGLLAP